MNVVMAAAASPRCWRGKMASEIHRVNLFGGTFFVLVVIMFALIQSCEVLMDMRDALRAIQSEVCDAE